MNIVNASSAVTAANNDEIRCDTTGASFTITFPASPAVNNKIRVVDSKRNFGVNAVTVSVSPFNIEGNSSVLLSQSGAIYEFVYITGQWLMFFETSLNPYNVTSVTPQTNVTASISNNNLTIGLGSGVLVANQPGITDGQFMVVEGTSWKNKTLTSSDITLTDAANTVTLEVNKGSLTETGSSVLTITNGSNALLRNSTVQVAQSSGSQSGFLSNTDWTTFNNKLGALSTSSSALSVSGSAVNVASVAANTVLAGPASGGNAVGAFRALVSGDIFPSILSGVFTQGMFAIYGTTNFLATSAITWLSNVFTVNGTIKTQAIQIDETIAGRTSGQSTLGVNGRVTILTTAVDGNSRIHTTYQNRIGISREMLFITTVVNNTSFVIQSSNSSDRSVVNWLIISP